MAKSKEFELQYKIIGLKRMMARKVRRQHKSHKRKEEKILLNKWDKYYYES